MLIADPNDERAMELVKLHPVAAPVLTFTRKQKALNAEFEERFKDGRIIRIAQKHQRYCMNEIRRYGIVGNAEKDIQLCLQVHYKEVYDICVNESVEKTTEVLDEVVAEICDYVKHTKGE